MSKRNNSRISTGGGGANSPCNSFNISNFRLAHCGSGTEHQRHLPVRA